MEMPVKHCGNLYFIKYIYIVVQWVVRELHLIKKKIKADLSIKAIYLLGILSNPVLNTDKIEAYSYLSKGRLYK